MSTSFYDTIGLTGPALDKAQSSAKSQEAEILRLFRSGYIALAPSEVLRLLNTRAPITSIRRAMTNLTTQGLLVKLDSLQPGPFGKPEHAWSLAGTEPTQLYIFEETEVSHV